MDKGDKVCGDQRPCSSPKSCEGGRECWGWNRIGVLLLHPHSLAAQSHSLGCTGTVD